jgi:diguanylate cyclase (GGDEF)-like protein
MADINGQKEANDTYGHDAGDELISGAAECLSRGFEEAGTVYRLGGDEFGVIFCHHTKKEIDEFIKRVSEKVSKNDFKFNFSFSVGTAKYAKGMSVTDLLNAADKEMYEHKRIVEANLKLEK